MVFFSRRGDQVNKKSTENVNAQPKMPEFVMLSDTSEKHYQFAFFSKHAISLYIFIYTFTLYMVSWICYSISPKNSSVNRQNSNSLVFPHFLTD